MVIAVRNVQRAIGDGVKKPASIREERNRDVARKSIVAKCDIKQGEIFSEENLTCKRPGNGISPMKWNLVIGQKAVRDFKKDEQIEL